MAWVRTPPMNRLILFRHGKAERTAATGKDFDRALAPRGHEDARLIAEALAGAGFAPDLALVSAARRTRETWEAAQPAFPDARSDTLTELYNAGSGLILRVADEAEEAGTVMVVGHNPGIHEAAIRLAVRGDVDPALASRLTQGFPTATAAVLRIEGAKAVLEDLLVPKDYGGGSEP